jgi:hypothetical protein
MKLGGSWRYGIYLISWKSQLILKFQDLVNGIDLGEQINIILFDFSKAFD